MFSAKQAPTIENAREIITEYSNSLRRRLAYTVVKLALVALVPAVVVSPYSVPTVLGSLMRHRYSESTARWTRYHYTNDGLKQLFSP